MEGASPVATVDSGDQDRLAVREKRNCPDQGSRRFVGLLRAVPASGFVRSSLAVAVTAVMV